MRYNITVHSYCACPSGGYLNWGGALGVADLLVALLECIRLESLPRQVSPQKIHEHVTQGLKYFCTKLAEKVPFGK